MEDTCLETEKTSETACQMARLLRDHKGIDALVLDLRTMNAWTDFFVIATATSGAHLDGLERQIKEFCQIQGLDVLRRSHKPDGEEDEWRIIDLGAMVVHLMSSKARAFYELERLYSQAQIVNS